jgi:hypothetical protein
MTDAHRHTQRLETAVAVGGDAIDLGEDLVRG